MAFLTRDAEKRRLLIVVFPVDSFCFDSAMRPGQGEGESLCLTFLHLISRSLLPTRVLQNSYMLERGSKGHLSS